MGKTFAEIDQLTKEMEDDSKAIKEDLFRLSWYMRGSLSVADAYNLTTEDREILNKIIEKNLEITKETKLPFF